MKHTEQRTDRRAQAEGHRRSVLDGKAYIAGFPTSSPSSIDEARIRGEDKACHSVLDGPACIVGLGSKQ